MASLVGVAHFRDNDQQHTALRYARLVPAGQAFGKAGVNRFAENQKSRHKKKPAAMNRGLREASAEVVLFLDDDLVPDETLIEEHARLHLPGGPDLVAGHVIQPWHGGESHLSLETTPTREFMGGNFSVKRALALALGGFDENFLRVAYRFEAEFAGRLRDAGGTLLFNPAALVRHLKVDAGGTREYGLHYRTIRPDHAVGEYYYLLRGVGVRGRMRKLLWRPFRTAMTRFHLRHPWWIPVTLVSEILGLTWALALALRGPRYMSPPATQSTF